MTDGSWKTSERLDTALAEWFARFESSQGRIDYLIYPSVMWSLGGSAYQASRPANTRIGLPAGYSAGFYRRDPMPKGERLIFVPNKRFGLVVFLPRDVDLASDRRLIDYDGKAIVVR